ncbi:WXG100 family type VII secretion target [Nocardia blacklockiae]|uniref:WXG100 family type VII secretion target n=1 Tax=Nocardia blacklockiae TaxID=480036 RepID=UPI001892EA9D|nr:WXG100 family type VII secretion target [Nocardia blacklockiae]MBF6171359.1 WXG100 family type VII secretion target [Nocardia blacklockiae]
MGLAADHAAFVSFTNTMKQKFDDINGRVNVARGHASTLDGPAFQGGAGSAFKVAFENFLTKAQSLNNALMQNAENLEQVTRQFGNTEEEQLASLRSAGDAITGGGSPAPAPVALNMNT